MAIVKAQKPYEGSGHDNLPAISVSKDITMQQIFCVRKLKVNLIKPFFLMPSEIQHKCSPFISLTDLSSHLYLIWTVFQSLPKQAVPGGINSWAMTHKPLGSCLRRMTCNASQLPTSGEVCLSGQLAQCKWENKKPIYSMSQPIQAARATRDPRGL